jgi:trehalose-6-phosphatase
MHPNNRLLFLDFDGVLHSTTSASEDLFCRAELLSDLLLEHPCNVVISSSWRFNSDLQDLSKRLPSPLSKLVVGKTGTPETGRWPRYLEIKQYVKVNKPLADWRALDDAFLEFPKDCPELILCHPKYGITQTEINKLKEWLIN